MNRTNRTQLTWIAALTALIALALAGCTAAATTPAPIVPSPTPTATPSPSQTPTRMPTATPTRAPTATPTPEPLVWWQLELYEVKDVGTGQVYLMAPQEVVDEVIAQQKESQEGLAIYDLEAYKAALPTYYTGEMLQEQLVSAEEDVNWEIREEGITRIYEVKDFTPDGLACTLGMTQRGGKMSAKDRRTGEVEEWFSDTLTMMRMRYDLDDRRWKMAEVIEIISLGQ
jgi:hypothetical protein